MQPMGKLGQLSDLADRRGFLPVSELSNTQHIQGRWHVPLTPPRPGNIGKQHHPVYGGLGCKPAVRGIFVKISIA